MKPLSLRPRSSTVAGLFGVLLLSACSGSSGDGGSGAESQTTVDDWRDYCIATFTEEYPVLDGFGDVAFTTQVGEEFVLASFDADDNPEIVYLADTGPRTIEIEEDALPFTSNCTAGAVARHYAVFSDTTVYAEEELSTSLCDLTAGDAMPLELTGAGYGITGSSGNEGVVYEVILNAFSGECGGAERGYVDVPQTVLFGSYTHLVPVIVIVGPNLG